MNYVLWTISSFNIKGTNVWLVIPLTYNDYSMHIFLIAYDMKAGLFGQGWIEAERDIK